MGRLLLLDNGGSEQTVEKMLVPVTAPTRNRATSFPRDCVAPVARRRLPQGWEIEHIIADTAHDVSMVAHTERLREWHSGWPELPNNLPVWGSLPTADQPSAEDAELC